MEDTNAMTDFHPQSTTADDGDVGSVRAARFVTVDLGVARKAACRELARASRLTLSALFRQMVDHCLEGVKE